MRQLSSILQLLNSEDIRTLVEQYFEVCQEVQHTLLQYLCGYGLDIPRTTLCILNSLHMVIINIVLIEAMQVPLFDDR